MGTKYSSNSASGYNATPPADDGTVSEANKVKWSTIKTKLADPVKDLADTINTELATHFDRGPTAITTNTTLAASHYNQFVQASGSGVTLTLTDASTLGAGWFCDILNTDTSNTIALARATASNTINATSADVTIIPLQALRVFVNAAANGFLVSETNLHNKTIWFSEGADVASAGTTNIWTTDGNTCHITGTTTITSFGTAPKAGAVKWVIFDGALTLTHAANLNLPGSANITTAAGDFARVYADTTTQFDVQYFKANGRSVISGPDIQTFTSSGTWTKPSGFASTSRVLIQAWAAGGGGGGSYSNAYGGGGGGGGGYAERWLTLSSLGATETVTVGTGGAGGNSSVGFVGGNTSVGSLITVYGGSGGGFGAASADGGSGGGAFSTGGAPTSSGGTAGTSGSGAGGNAEFNGGGGGGANNTGTGGTGGSAIYGGGGGGGGVGNAGGGGTGGTGGSSINGGAGGNGSGTATGSNGTAPGGGGGGGGTTSGAGYQLGGNGADGQVIVTVFS